MVHEWTPRVSATVNIKNKEMQETMISLNKRNVAILLLAIILFAMLPLEFTWDDSALEYMDFGNEPMSAALFWIFYIFVIATAIAALFNRYDIAKLTGIICLVFSVILLIQTLNTVNYGSDSFISILFGCTQFAYAYIILTIVILVLTLKTEAKAE